MYPPEADRRSTRAGRSTVGVAVVLSKLLGALYRVGCSENGRQERHPLQDIDLQVGRRADGSRPRNIAEQGELTEVVAWAQLADGLPAHQHRRLTGDDDVELLAGFALADHDLP